jgi:anti-sigma-K factor RskA
VSACPTHGDLIGPYLLGALEPDEMEEMRRHIEGCPRCAAEERALAGLPSLLDRTQADESPAMPPPQLEDAVLDRFVRDRAAAEGAPRRRRLSWRPLAVAAAAAAAIAVGLVLLLPAGDDRAYGRAELRGHGAWALASLAEVEAGTRVHVRAADLRRGTYELWCVRGDGRWVSGGSFQSRSDGTAAAELTAAVRPGDYHVVVITRRSEGGERGAEVMRGEVEY